MAKEQHKQGQRKKKKQQCLDQRIVLEEENKIRFREVRDLLSLEFSLDGKRILNVYDALPLEMGELARFYFDVSDVDPDVWSVGERLDFVNALWGFCQRKNFAFPLSIRQVSMSSVDLSEAYVKSNLASNLASNFGG